MRSGDLLALEEIGEDTLLELGRRLSDPEEAAKLPASGLLTIATKYLSYLDVKARMKAELADQHKDTPVLDLIQSHDITPERRLEILDEYIATLRSDLDHATKLREEFESGDV